MNMLAAEALSFRGRRVAGFGLGAPWQVILAPCAKVSFSATGWHNSGSTPQLDPTQWKNVTYIVGANGDISLQGTWIGSTQPMPASFPDSVQGSSAPWTVTSYTITLPPAGTHWNGNACVAPVVFQQPTPPANAGQQTSTQHASLPIGGGTGAGVFTLEQGHRVQVVIATDGTVALPPDYQGETIANVQAQMNAMQPGVQVVSVVYEGASTATNGNPTAVFVVVDHCAASKTVPSPASLSVGGVAVGMSYQDQGPSPAGACSAPGSSSSNTTTYVIAGVTAAAVIGGIVWAMGR